MDNESLYQVNQMSRRERSNLQLASPDHINNLLKEVQQLINNGTIKLNDIIPYQELSATFDTGGDEPMSDNGYITEKDLIQLKDNLTQRMDTKFESLRNEMDLKFESTNNKIDSLRNEMDLKFENQYLKIEKLLNEKFNIQKEKQAANTKWIIGTFGMGLLSIAVAIILHFI